MAKVNSPHGHRAGARMPSEKQARRYLAVLVAITAVFVAGGSSASGRDHIDIRAAIGGRDLATSSTNRPIPLQDEEPSVMKVTVTNGSSTEILVRSVRLQGRVLGLTMFSYEARVDLRVPPSATDEVTYEMELVDLSRQAVGFIPARVQLLDADRKVLASQDFESDVDGSARSVYGLFGLIIAAITLVLFVTGLIRLAAHRLPANRWKRGVRFGVVGVGIGLTITFTLSAFGILFPSPGLWVSLLLLGGAGMFGFGYATPNPDDLQPEEDDADSRATLQSQRQR